MTHCCLNARNTVRQGKFIFIAPSTTNQFKVLYIRHKGIEKQKDKTHIN